MAGESHQADGESLNGEAKAWKHVPAGSTGLTMNPPGNANQYAGSQGEDQMEEQNALDLLALESELPSQEAGGDDGKCR